MKTSFKNNALIFLAFLLTLFSFSFSELIDGPPYQFSSDSLNYFPQFPNSIPSRRLFKKLTTSPIARQLSVVPAERQLNSSQERLTAEFNNLANTVQTLNLLVDQKIKGEQNKHKKNKLQQTQIRKIESHNKKSTKRNFYFTGPKFDPVFSAEKTMQIYNRKIAETNNSGGHNVENVNMKNLIQQNTKKLDDYSDFSGFKKTRAQKSKIKVLFSDSLAANKHLRDFYFNARKSDLIRKTNKQKWNSMDLIHKIINKKNSFRDLNKLRAEGDLISRINRNYNDKRLSLRSIPKHDLREEYEKSSDAMEQIFGPVHKKKTRRLKSRKNKQQKRRIILRKKNRIAKGFLKNLKNNSVSKSQNLNPSNLLKSIFGIQNKQDDRIASLNPSLNALFLKKWSLPKMNFENQSNPIFQPSFFTQTQNLKLRQLVGPVQNPLMNDLYSFSRFEPRASEITYPTLGHRGIQKGLNSLLFKPTLKHIVLQKREHDNLNRSSHFWKKQRNEISLENEIDGILNELGQTKLKELTNII